MKEIQKFSIPKCLHSALLTFVCLMAVTIFLTSCNNRKKYDPGVALAIEQAGDNQAEILKIINHYSKSAQDSLKLKAASFLISSLKGHYFYQSDLLNHYLDYGKLVRRNTWQGEYVMKSLNDLYGPYRLDKVFQKYHLQEIKADSIIREIDFAFFVWERQPWSKQYSFADFCEFVLPFFIDNEIPEYNRETLYRIYNPLLDSLRKANGSVLQAGFIINEKLRKDGWGFTVRQSFLPHLGPSRLLKYRIGNCHDMADLATYVFRSLGIPVGNDFVQQWPDMRLGHNWNILILPGGKNVPFLGSEDNPGVPHLPGTKKGKVYRQMFKSNPESLASLKEDNEYIPDFLRSPFIKDVTDEYTRCLNIRIPLKGKGISRHVYLAVFNDKIWVPVAWGTAKNDTGYFAKIEPGIVYLPVYYNSSGYVPANSPFILDTKGSLKILSNSSRNSAQELICRQVAKIVPQYIDLVSSIGNYFEGANKSDFSDAKILYTITSKTKPSIFWNTIELQRNSNYRFIRYCQGRGDYYDCNLAELAVYADNRKVRGKVITGKKQTANDPFGMKNIEDNNFTTAFSTEEKRCNSWVGYDLKKTTTIDKLMFAIGMRKQGPEFFVKSGHRYELRAWKDGVWISYGKNIAKRNSVSFHNVPTGGLYLIHDETQNVEERIFTYEKDQIVFY